MAKLHVSTTINGEPAEFLCEPYDTMLDALRGPLGLTGSKEGCASGDCGACSAACRPIDDKRGTIIYRTKVAGVLLKRTVAIAARRAAGGN